MQTIYFFHDLFEAYYITKRKAGESKAIKIYDWLSTLPIERVNLEEPILVRAGDLKAKHEISAIDAWVIATALIRNAVIIHKDSEFDTIRTLPISFINISRNAVFPLPDVWAELSPEVKREKREREPPPNIWEKS